MKKAIIILGIIGLILSMHEYDKYTEQRLYQAMDGWQSKIYVAQLKGKSPAEVSAFLDQYGVSESPYIKPELVHYKDKSYREGYILAHTLPIAYVTSFRGSWYYSIQMTFTFDEQNKFQSSCVSAGPS